MTSMRVFTMAAPLALITLMPGAAVAQSDAVQGVERKVVDVRSRTGLVHKVTITRPQGTVERRPALLFTPWMDCDSLAIPDKGLHGGQLILKHLIEQSGWVVARIDKPGVGGSEGVCADADFDAELAGFQAAFAALEADEWSAPGGVAVAGFSFSGGVAPLISQGRPVRGYLVMSSWVRTWFERLLEFERLRMMAAGTEPAKLAHRMRLFSQLYATYLNEQLTPGQVIAAKPALAEVWEGSGTHQYGRAARFFHQLQALNLEDIWSRVNEPTLAVWGDGDLAMHRIDHERIVALVNARTPGAAALKVAAGAGHDLTVSGQVPPDVLRAIDDWLRTVAGPAAQRR